MLTIFPDDCIDCGLCVSECPVDAIEGPLNEDDDLNDEQRYWLDINIKYSAMWPEITEVGEVPADADNWKDVAGKRIYFSAKPGKG